MEHCLAKIGIGLLLATSYALFCWGVFVSPNSISFVALVALALSVLNFTGTTALWVFYLSKQFSTHSVKVLDLKQSAQQKKPVIKDSLDVDDEDEDERELKNFAESTVSQLFKPTKEKLTDSLF